METEAFLIIWYCCPECSFQNTVRMVDNPYVLSGFNCQNCNHIWTVKTLHQAFGSIFPSDDKMRVSGCVEFMCECGEINIIFAKQINITDSSIDGSDMRVRIISYEDPKFGLCEECGANYKLIYPLSESMENWLRNQRK